MSKVLDVSKTEIEHGHENRPPAAARKIHDNSSRENADEFYFDGYVSWKQKALEFI